MPIDRSRLAMTLYEAGLVHVPEETDCIGPSLELAEKVAPIIESYMDATVTARCFCGAALEVHHATTVRGPDGPVLVMVAHPCPDCVSTHMRNQEAKTA